MFIWKICWEIYHRPMDPSWASHSDPIPVTHLNLHGQKVGQAWDVGLERSPTGGIPPPVGWWLCLVGSVQQTSQKFNMTCSPLEHRPGDPKAEDRLPFPSFFRGDVMLNFGRVFHKVLPFTCEDCEISRIRTCITPPHKIWFKSNFVVELLSAKFCVWGATKIYKFSSRSHVIERSMFRLAKTCKTQYSWDD